MNDLLLKAPYVKGDIQHTNIIKFRQRQNYLQIWVENMPAGKAGIRFLKRGEIDQMIAYLNLIKNQLEE